MSSDIAVEARNELKKAGLNSRQVSVRHRPCGYSSKLIFTIRDDKVSERMVEDIAKRFKCIDYDRRTMEILEGGNTYVSVVRKWQDENGPAIPDDFKKAWETVLENSRTEGKLGEGTEYDGHVIHLDGDGEVHMFLRNTNLPYHRGVRMWRDGTEVMLHVWRWIYNDRLDLKYLESRKEVAG